MGIETATGAYTEERAAALSGVPRSTVNLWKRQALVPASVSPERVALWSWDDLVLLRYVYWLRRRKTLTERDGVPEVPATQMSDVRAAVAKLRDDYDRPGQAAAKSGVLRVDVHGRLFRREGHLLLQGNQIASEKLVSLIGKFPTDNGLGPDLRHPRPLLSIIPSKLGGSPHIEGTRIETVTISALVDAGYRMRTLLRYYPGTTRLQIEQAVELERQLSGNLDQQAA